MKLEKIYYLRSLVSSGDLHFTVGVDFECNLNVRNAARSGRNAQKLKFSKQVVVLGQRTLALEDLNENSGLVISRGGYLTLAQRDDSVASNKFSEDTTSGLNSGRKRAGVNENNVLRSLFTRENTSLDSSSICDNLMRLIPLEGSCPK